VTDLRSINVEATALVETLPLRPAKSRLFSELPYVVHGMTSRVRGLGVADGNVGYGAPRDPEDAWTMRKRWAEAIGFDASSIVGLRQIHGHDVAEASTFDTGKGAIPGSEPLARADALISREWGVTLMTLHADCLPILVVDPQTPAVAAIHAGWRGTVEDVAGATIRAMIESFGSHPAELLAFFGPSIGPCCYEVGPEVANAWLMQADALDCGSIVVEDGTTSLDLREANQLLLRRAGLSPEHIEVTEICTKCCGDDWFSHRGQGAATGRFAAFFALTDLTS